METSKNEFPEKNENQDLGFSKKTNRLIGAFSLLVSSLLSGNALAQDSYNYLNENKNNDVSYSVENISSENFFNELKYFFIQNENGFISAISEKLKDDGVYDKGFILELKKYEEHLTYFFSLILENEEEYIAYRLSKKALNDFFYIRLEIVELLKARYGILYSDIFFDGKDHSDLDIFFKFKLKDGKFIIVDLYIEKNQEK